MFNILLDISDQRRVKLLETEHPLPLSLPPLLLLPSSPPPQIHCAMYNVWSES